MKRLYALKAIISVLFVINIIVVAFGVPFTIIYALAPERIPHSLITKLHDAESGAIFSAINLVILLIGGACSAYALYCLKQVLTVFSKGKYFDLKVIEMLHKTGKYTIWFCLLVSLAFLITPTVSGSYRLKFSLNLSSIIFLGIGLLFLVLADVFNAARKLKEENDLTV